LFCQARLKPALIPLLLP